MRTLISFDDGVGTIGIRLLADLRGLCPAHLADFGAMQVRLPSMRHGR